MHEFAQAIETLDSGRFAPQHLISGTIGLVSLPTVFEALRQRTTECKVLIDPFGLEK
jgi:threonine dehydrogenase-like Zn-dependent dehydrogenase